MDLVHSFVSEEYRRERENAKWEEVEEKKEKEIEGVEVGGTCS